MKRRRDEQTGTEAAAAKPASSSQAAASAKPAAAPRAALPHELQVYAEGFPYDTSDEALHAFFAPCGTVTQLKAPRWQDSGRLRGFAHVSFASRAEAEGALALSGTRLGSRYISVAAARADTTGARGAAPSAARPAGCVTLFVRNLPYDADEAAVTSAFARFGDVATARVVRRSDTHVSKGFAYVQFARGAAAEAAVAAGVTLGGRALQLDYDAVGKAKASYKDPPSRAT